MGPFLVLKLCALLHRQHGKDAFDLLYTILHYDAGTERALEAFAQEAKADNPAFPDARKALENLLINERGPGPVKAAHFVFGAQSSGDSEGREDSKNPSATRCSCSGKELAQDNRKLSTSSSKIQDVSRA